MTEPKPLTFLRVVKLNYLRKINNLILAGIMLILTTSLQDVKAIGIFDQYRVHEVKYEK